MSGDTHAGIPAHRKSFSYGYRACRDTVIEPVEILFVNLKKVRTKAMGMGAKNINTRKSYFFLCGKKSSLKTAYRKAQVNRLALNGYKAVRFHCAGK